MYVILSMLVIVIVMTVLNQEWNKSISTMISIILVTVWNKSAYFNIMSILYILGLSTYTT